MELEYMKRALFLLLLLPLAACTDMTGQGILKVGMKAPAVKTKTLADVGGDLGRITSYHWPNPAMYKYSEAQALKLHKPIIMEFATPAHCTECDEQMEMLKMVMAKFGSQIIVLHMDQYYNPEAYRVFQVRGEPWTVLIGKAGYVRRIFPGRTLHGEISPVVTKLLKEPWPPVKKPKPATAAGKKPGATPKDKPTGQVAER
jgi:hypothetical protein